MRSVSIRATVLVVALLAALTLSGETNATQPVRQFQASVAQLREPDQPPLERRLRSIIRRFITSVFGELDVPHP